jgi:hypothetical protein
VTLVRPKPGAAFACPALPRFGVAADQAAFIARQLSGIPVPPVQARESEERGGIPNEAGFYAWWTLSGAIPEVPPQPHPTARATDLFYVGIAPRDATSTSTIRSRVLDFHLGGNTGSSSLRQAVAALLLDSLALAPRRATKKVVLPKEDNKRLSTWFEEHLLLTWCKFPEPWSIEDLVIAVLRPPLNLAKNSAHPFYPALKTSRRRFRAAAHS